MTAEDRTFELLEGWSHGDPEALKALLTRDLDWISEFVHRRLSQDLRRIGDTDDFVQEALLAVLECGPRFVVADQGKFRALLAAIVLNIIRTRHRQLFTLKRDPRRESPLPSDTALYLDPPRRPVTRPDHAAARHEEEEWLRLALLLARADDQEVIHLHRRGLSDAEIGQELGLSANSARMRRSRALSRLTQLIVQLKSGEVLEVLSREQAGGT